MSEDKRESKARLLAFPLQPGMKQKRHRRKKCPDEYMELPPAPKLYEFDPVIFEEMEEAGRKLVDAFEKYGEKIPPLWWDYIAGWAANWYKSAITTGNDALMKEYQNKETEIRQGLKLVKFKG